jgi:hypothetical protein
MERLLPNSGPNSSLGDAVRRKVEAALAVEVPLGSALSRSFHKISLSQEVQRYKPDISYFSYSFLIS